MLIAENLSLKRGRKLLVDGVSIRLRAGEVTVLLGPNGAGKSTLLNMLSGMTKPDSGEVLLQQQVISAMDPQVRACRLSMYTQHQPLNFPFRVEEVVAMGCYPLQLSQQAESVRVTEMMQQLQLEPLAGRQYPTLSGGERQRVQVARVLAQAGDESVVLLLDEPLSEMDLNYQQLVLSRLRDLADQGKAVCCVLHDLNLAAQIADQVVLMRQGRVLAAGMRDEVMNETLLTELYQIPVSRVSNSVQPVFVSRPDVAQADRPVSE